MGKYRRVEKNMNVDSKDNECKKVLYYKTLSCYGRIYYRRMKPFIIRKIINIKY